MTLKAKGGGYSRSMFRQDAEIATLRAEIERLKADAERYRWLRDQRRGRAGSGYSWGRNRMAILIEQNDTAEWDAWHKATGCDWAGADMDGVIDAMRASAPTTGSR